MVNCAPNCPRGNMDKTKEWQMEMLMEKLRSKANQYRSFYDSAKALRMTLMEKRFSIDSLDRSQLQKCLDTLQQNMKVTSHQAMVERLESVSRQLGLKFVSGQSGLELFISSDMFYLEILLENNGGVKDVKIHHEGRSDQQPQSCDELVACLARRDFADLTAQLEGLSSIYQINAEKKTKARAYTALTSLEADVISLASIHSSYTKDPFTIVHATPLGFVQKRRGGHPMKLTYLVPPCQLIDISTRIMKPLILEPGLDLGFSVSVCVESSTAHKLQTTPLVTLNRCANGVTAETYTPLSVSNSMTVAGCFALTLSHPMVICTSLISAMEAVTGVSIGTTSASPLLGLLVADAGATSDNLFANIADQHHCYLLTESGLSGVIVKTIPFTHPSHIGQIITLLRQQALFNTVISSCIRPNTPQDVEKMIMLEVSPLSCEHVSVSVEHPVEECMATVELDLADITALSCRVYTSSGDPMAAVASSDYATTVFQKTMSIPVTMRSLIRMWNMEQAQRMTGLYNGGGGGLGGSGAGSGQGEHDVEFDPDLKIKLEPGSSGSTSGFSRHSGGAFDSEYTEEEEHRGTKRKRKDDWSDKGRYDDSIDSSSSSSSPAPASLELIRTTDLGDLGDKTDVDQDSRDSDVVKTNKKKRREEKKSAADILLDLEHKNLVPPSVSITPISSSQLTTPSYSVLSEMGLERRPGIEIIPLPSSTTAALPSSITITPIPSKTQESKSDKKSSKSRSDQKGKPDKKKKRKRDESPTMGPPEKVPPKPSDPLSKPVTVSIIKPAESLSPRPSSPAIRKYSSSPTHTSPLALSSLTGKSSPTLSKAAVKASPKHSPASYTGSPKNSLASSPKHGSPKHQSTSGKPSLSALKSSVTSPSKSDLKGKSKDSKDRDKKGSSSSGYSSPKSKGSSSSSSGSCSSVKSKSSGEAEGGSPSSVQSGGSSSPSGDGGKSSAGASHLKNRKGSLSAVVDKLKSALGQDELKKERTSSSSGSVSASKAAADSKVPPKPGDKSGEYSVKQGSEGMKLIINKKSKESYKSKSSSSSDSPKSHSGIKTSSLTSKKLAHSKSSSGISFKSSSSSKPIVKSSSSSSLRTKPASPKPGDRSKDKPRPKDKSLLSKMESSRKMSPSLSDGDFTKSLPSSLSITPQLPDNDVLVALTSGKLDRNYQIPKLSARSNTDQDKKRDRSSSDSPKIDSKDKESRSDKAKYYSSSSASKVSKLPIDLSDSPNLSIIPVPRPSDKSGNESGDVEDILQSLKMDLPVSSISMMPVTEKDDSSKKVEVSDLLLDLTGGGKDNSAGSPGSISVHIVKSPASTQIVMSSPTPPFIDDDELMDEAVVGNCK